MTSTAAKPEVLDGPEQPLTHRQILTILVGLMMGMFLAALDQTIVASAMRVIADDLHGLSAQAWVTTAYLITATIVTPIYGKLSDIYGRKFFFIFAISIFTVGSALCAAATSIGTLAAYRAIQGLGAGGLFSLALAIIGDIVPPRERAKYQGYFLAVFGTSSVLGPVIGGFFAGQDTLFGITGWRWVFLVNVPIAVAALLVVSRTLHLHHTRLDHRIDWWGAALLSVALVPLLIVAEQGREWGWASAGALACYAVGVVGLVGFLLAERAMGEEALIPLRLFSNRTVGISSVGSIFVGIGMFGALVSLPLYLQIVKGATPTEAGLMLVPMTLGIMAGSISSGIAISKTGQYRRFPVTGAVLLSAGLFVLHFTKFDTPLWQTMVVMVFLGLGLGFNFQPLTLAVQNAVSPRDIGVATSTATFTRQIGGTIGTAVFLSVLFSTVPDKLSTAFRSIAPTADFQAALASPQGDPAANQAFITSLQAAQSGGGTVGADALNDSSFINLIDPRLAKPFLVGFSEAMDVVFLLGAIVMLGAIVVLFFLPHVELRSGSSYDERNAAAGERTQDEAHDAPVPVAVGATSEASVETRAQTQGETPAASSDAGAPAVAAGASGASGGYVGRHRR